MKNLLIALALILSASILSASAYSQVSEEGAQDAVTDRQAVYKLISYNFGPLAEMIRGKEFNQEEVVQGLQRLSMLAEMIPEMFDVDTRGIENLTTRAMDNIWTNQDDFLALANGLVDNTNAAIEILNQQGAEGLRPALDQIRPYCGDCHQQFRSN